MTAMKTHSLTELATSRKNDRNAFSVSNQRKERQKILSRWSVYNASHCVFFTY